MAPCPRRTGTKLRLLLLVTALSSVASPATAQSVIGQLRDANDQRPITGALVLVVDTAGRRLARSVTDVHGRYRVTVASPGRYRLEAQRIGYENATSPLLSVGTGALNYNFEIRVAPVELPTIEVASRDRGCERRPDGARVVTLWNEIRKALDVAAWTSEVSVLQYTTHAYRITVDPDSRFLLKATGETSAASSLLPFATESAAELAQTGFGLPDSTDLIVFGPDAEVLTSDEFMDGHCFKLTADPAAPDRVGLSFEPLRRRRNIIDIRGTLWADRTSGALRQIEYAYTNLPEPMGRYGITGEVEFEGLPNGLWIVRSWRIQSPSLTTVMSSDGRQQVLLRGHGEAGGIVLRAVEQDEIQYAFAGEAGVAGTLRTEMGGSPIPDAHVFLVGTGQGAVTDANGRFRISDLPPGRYVLAFSHHLLEDLGVPLPLDSIQFVAGVTSKHDLTLPRWDEILPKLCPSIRSSGTPGLLYGFATDSTGAPAVGVQVRASWDQSDARFSRGRESAPTDANGRYAICGLPIHVEVTLQASRGRTTKTWDTRIPSEGLRLQRLDFRW